MFIRSILLPSIVACAVGVPIVCSTDGSNNRSNVSQANQRVAAYPPSFASNVDPQIAAINSAPVYAQNAPGSQFNAGVPLRNEFPPQGNVASLQPPQLAPPATPPAGLHPSIVGNQPGVVAGGMQLPAGASFPPGMVVSGPVVFNSSLTTGTPDFGAAETFVFPGDANGPDLTAKPTDFIPVSNLAEIIRFDVFPNWVKSRWSRVSTNPGDAGLHGLRVALVTGTNTWDLHGSLTYYFDANQRAQRIKFRGWTGDSSRLVNLLTSQFGLRAQPTHWAGAYAAQTKHGVPNAGLLMQHPAIITRENPVQQVALVMELNHPEGSFQLSDEFMNMLRYAVETR